jgi:cytochrome c biogenesis protein
VGLTTSLFVRRRRVWFSARVDGSGRTVVEGAALARGDDPGLTGEVRALLEAAGLPAPRTTTQTDAATDAGRVPATSGPAGSAEPAPTRHDKE